MGDFEQVYNPLLPYPNIEMERREDPGTLKKTWMISATPKVKSDGKNEGGKRPNVLRYNINKSA